MAFAWFFGACFSRFFEIFVKIATFLEWFQKTQKKIKKFLKKHIFERRPEFFCGRIFSACGRIFLLHFEVKKKIKRKKKILDPPQKNSGRRSNFFFLGGSGNFFEGGPEFFFPRVVWFSENRDFYPSYLKILGLFLLVFLCEARRNFLPKKKFWVPWVFLCQKFQNRSCCFSVESHWSY